MRFNNAPSLATVPMGALGAKLVASLALVGAAASIAGLGTYATFTSSTPATSQSVASGTLTVAVGTAGTAANRLTVAASNIAPGDTIERAVDLTNSGNLDFASMNLTTSASTSSLLDTDATNGLQMTIDRCSVAWTESGTAPAYTYTCVGGTKTTVLASSPVIQSSIPLTGMSSQTAGGTDHLHVTLTLPTTAGNTFQTKTSVIDYVFGGTQRAATSK
jgi:spore coat-associated protein N